MTMRYLRCLAVLLFLSCHETTGSTSPATASQDEVKRSLSEIRERPRLRIQMRLADAGTPSAADLGQRRTLEEKLEHDRIGTVVDESTGSGFIDFTIQVDSTVTAIPKIDAIVRAAGLADRTAVTVKQ
jgi:hypothetical protein